MTVAFTAPVTEAQPWRCRGCKARLGVVLQPGGVLRLETPVGTVAVDPYGVVAVQCPRCSRVRQWMPVHPPSVLWLS